nr:MAG TPA: hypothetical protein [Caudoviricetes sp.]
MKTKSKSVKIETSNIVVGKNDDSTDLTPVSCTYKLYVSGMVAKCDVFAANLSGRRLRKVRAKGGDTKAVIKQSAARRLVESLLINTAATTEYLRGATTMARIFSPVKITHLTVQIVDTLAESLGFKYEIKVTE